MAKGTSKQSKSNAEARADRLKAALKANMGRRKAQSRARQGADEKKESPTEAGKEGS